MRRICKKILIFEKLTNQNSAIKTIQIYVYYVYQLTDFDSIVTLVLLTLLF